MPRYEDHGENFYYIQEDFMFQRQQGKKWSYNIIRPNAIVGFTPGSKITFHPTLLNCRYATLNLY
jgi:hypothetical protein